MFGYTEKMLGFADCPLSANADQHLAAAFLDATKKAVVAHTSTTTTSLKSTLLSSYGAYLKEPTTATTAANNITLSSSSLSSTTSNLSLQDLFVQNEPIDLSVKSVKSKGSIR